MYKQYFGKSTSKIVIVKLCKYLVWAASRVKEILQCSIDLVVTSIGYQNSSAHMSHTTGNTEKSFFLETPTVQHIAKSKSIRKPKMTKMKAIKNKTCFENRTGSHSTWLPFFGELFFLNQPRFMTGNE